MGYTPLPEISEAVQTPSTAAMPQRWLLHVVLFVLTFASCMLAGAAWQGVSPDVLDPATWLSGWTYAALIMLFISAHEFGHYFAARFHGVDATLPFYIPMPFLNVMPFGTMGAIIRTRSPIASRKVLFDVGVAGPLAGFVVCILILIVGFVSLPDKSYLMRIHPEYETLFGGEIPDFGLRFGDTLAFGFLASIFAKGSGFLPPMNEIYHYPFLCVGWFGLFVTSLNLLPIGQLDGGHVVYAMFGRQQFRIARVVTAVLLAIGGMALIGELRPMMAQDSPDAIVIFLQGVFEPPLQWLESNAAWVFDGWVGWLFWAALTRFIFRFNHPPVEDPEPLDTKRMVLGWVAIAVFICSLSLNGISIRSAEYGPDGTIQSKTVVHLIAAPGSGMSKTPDLLPKASASASRESNSERMACATH